MLSDHFTDALQKRDEQEQHWAEMKVVRDAAVEADYAQMRETNHPWSKYRLFVNTYEQVGAMRCDSTAHRRGKSRETKWVSYCRGIAGRTALCQNCYERTNG